MYISLQEIKYDDKPLVWTLDLDTTTAACEIPTQYSKVFRRAFKDKPNVSVGKSRIEITNARQFIEQDQYTVHLVINEQHTIPVTLQKLEELLGQLLVVTLNYEQIAGKLKEALSVMDADLLTRLFAVMDEHPLINSNHAVRKALKQARDDPAFVSRPARPATSQEEALIEQGEINRNLINLIEIAKGYDPVEEAMTSFLESHPSPVFELITAIIMQTDSLRTRGDGVWLRIMDRVMADKASSASDVSQWSSHQSASSSSTTHTSQRASPLIPSRSSSSSPRFFTPPSKCLNLDYVMDRKNLTQNEYRDTFIHEKDEFLAIAKQARMDQTSYPVHTLKSFHLLTTAIEKNIKLYRLKRQLINELGSLFNDSIDPAWRSMSQKKDDDAMQQALSDWFKQVVFEVMKAFPGRDETDKAWQKRHDMLMNKLAFLGSSTVSLKKLAVEKRIGETLQRLAGEIQCDNERKKCVKGNLKKIRSLTGDIGKLEFQSRERIEKITHECETGQTQVLGSELFSNMLLKSILKTRIPAADADNIVREANKAAIVGIKRANDQFVKRLEASGLSVEDSQYDAVVKQPTMLTNNYTSRFIYDKFYVAEPLLTSLRTAIPALVRESDLQTADGVNQLVSQIERFFELQISGLLSRQFAHPLQIANALGSRSEAATSSSSSEPPHPEPDEDSAPSGPSI